MKYSEIRHTLKSGDILAWSHTGWSSWYDFKLQLIRIFTKSEFVHVGIVWKFGTRVFILEATSPTPRIVPLSNKIPFYLLRLPKKISDKAIEYAMSHIGLTPYSTIEAIKSFFGTNSISNSRLQCVEYVKNILGIDGYNFTGKDITAEFIKELQQLGLTVELIEK